MTTSFTVKSWFDDDEEVVEEPTNPLSDLEKESLRKAFNKFDKKKTGSIKPSEIADVMRMAGQNPTLEQQEKMIAEAEMSGTGLMFLTDLVAICEKYWKNPIFFETELREACLAFDKQDLGVMDYDDLSHALIKYGDQLDEDDVESLGKHMHASDGKLIVEEFIKIIMPVQEEQKKPKKSSKKSAPTSAARNKKK